MKLALLSSFAIHLIAVGFASRVGLRSNTDDHFATINVVERFVGSKGKRAKIQPRAQKTAFTSDSLAPDFSESVNRDEDAFTDNDGPTELTFGELNGWNHGNRAPSYPRSALESGWQGAVRLLIRSNEMGEAVDVKLEKGSGYSVLDESAIHAARLWHFPKSGREALWRVPIEFTIDD